MPESGPLQWSRRLGYRAAEQALARASHAIRNHFVVGAQAARDAKSFVLRAWSSAKAASRSTCCFSRWAIWSAICDEDRAKLFGSPVVPSARVL